MSKTKVTAQELHGKIVDEIGDRGGLGIYVLRSDDGGWRAEVRSGSELIPGSGFQNEIDRIVAPLRLQYDLCPYSDVPPIYAENARRKARFEIPPGHHLRNELLRYAQCAEVGPHAPTWVFYRKFRRPS